LKSPGKFNVAALQETLEKMEALIASKLDDSAEYTAMAQAVFAE